jgi:hypothetical protein
MPIRSKTKENLTAKHAIEPSTLEDIDYAIFNYINEELDIFTDTNKGFKKVPVTFTNPERAFQIKSDESTRLDGQFLVFPQISIERTSVSKDPSNKGIYALHIPEVRDALGGSITIARQIKQSKTRDRANADSIRRSGTKEDPNRKTFPRENKKIVYETVSIPMPSYVHVTYNVKIRTEYQQQMNEIVAPFITKTGAQNSFYLERNGHRYEAFIQADFSQENNVASMGQEERSFMTTVEVKVLGHIIGEDKNQEKPKMVVRETAAEIKIQRERAVFEDELDFHLENKNKIRS